MFEDKFRSFLKFFWILPLIAAPGFILVGYFEAQKAHILNSQELREGRGGDSIDLAVKKDSHVTIVTGERVGSADAGRKLSNLSLEKQKREGMNIDLEETFEGNEMTQVELLKEKTRKLKGKLKKHQKMLDQLRKEGFHQEGPVNKNVCESKHLAPLGSRPIVALSSAPGSGNTWVRHLLESASGIFTGSIYSDKRLFRAGFFGEYEDPWSGTVLVVKCHRFKPENAQHYDTAIVLIRNPFKSMISEYNRILTGRNHTATANQSDFAGLDWQRFVRQMGDKWYGIIDKWLDKDPSIHITYYEDIIADTRTELEKMLRFLNVDIDPARMDCTIANQEGSFHRKSSKQFDPFTEDMKKYIDGRIEQANAVLLENGKPPLPDEYFSDDSR